MGIRLVLVLEATGWLIAGVTNGALAQDAQLARQGAGLLPEPTEIGGVLAGTPPQNPFVRDPSGEFSRIVFETNEHPDFKIVIRDYSFPPDRQAHSVILPRGGLLHVLGGQGEVSVANNHLAFAAAVRTAAPLGAPLRVVNNGEQPVVVRALSLEAK